MRKHFFVKLIPHRPTFAMDMSPEEKVLMQQHVSFWTAQMHQGNVHAFGPVIDPSGVYGIGIAEAESAEELRTITAQDPAANLHRFEIYPMRAVLPTQQ